MTLNDDDLIEQWAEGLSEVAKSQGPGLTDLLALVRLAQQEAVTHFVNEQCVRYQKHSGLAIQEDMKLAVELFGIDPYAPGTEWFPEWRDNE
jgi:hypothetical protein